tara:strand:+ start:217 stop:825 length:609 start_codon:yes stop_codon:yes gene_type:complete
MSTVETNLVQPSTGTTLTLGASGDTVDIPSGATLDVTGATVSGLSAGKVLQVVSAVKTDTASTTSGTLATTGLEVTITPSATSSKVLILINANLGTKDDVAPYFQVNRGATVLTGALGDAAGSRMQSAARTQYQYSIYNISPVPITYLDSPSSTSALTYKLMWAQGNPHSSFVSYLNRTLTDTDAAYFARSSSTITVMEIEG